MSDVSEVATTMEVVLRKCYVCGLEANKESELELFAQGTKYHKHGRQNICNECRRKRRRKGGMWDVTKLESRKLRADIHNKKMINFKGKKIYLGFNPRTNVCSVCGKKYPDDLDKQTFLHHTEYDESDPLAHTVEVCGGCHSRYHTLRRHHPEKDIQLADIAEWGQ